MPTVVPPFAYRLSLDSGVEFNNVKHAFDQPLAVRLDTWLRLLKSLGVSLVAAQRPQDVWSERADGARVLIGPEPLIPLPWGRASSLVDCRHERGWSMGTLAQRVGVSIDTVMSIERGRGLLRNVARVCEQYGMQLFIVLPPPYATLATLWSARAEQYLLAPAQFPVRRPTRRFDATTPAIEPAPTVRRRGGPPRKVVKEV
jgi:transcriptional regulator with XRE-family HTH domain